MMVAKKYPDALFFPLVILALALLALLMLKFAGRLKRGRQNGRWLESAEGGGSEVV